MLIEVPYRRPPGRLVRLWLVAGLAQGCGSSTTTPAQIPTQLGISVAPSPTAQSGVALARQPVIQLQDGHGDPVAEQGRQITVSLASTAGTLTGTLQVRTDATGKASFTDLKITGPVGGRALRFDAPGLLSATSAPVQLSAGTAAAITVAAGDFQTAEGGAALSVAPSVLIADGSGNPIAGAPVLFAVLTGGGTVTGGSAITNAGGLASPGSWTLGTAIGLNTLGVTSTAVPGVSVTFTATAILGAPAALSIVAGESQTATVGGATSIAPSVKLTDAAGHPLPGVAVSFAVGTGGGSVTVGAPLTDANGVATVGAWSLGLLPGPNTLTASRTGVPGLTFHATGADFPVIAVDAGADHSCALDPAGQAYCWGVNAAGQIGNGLTIDVKVPTAVSGGLTFTSISIGSGYSCGLVTGGDAYCWGDNSVGQIGDGTNTSRRVPTAVIGGLKFSSLAAGGSHVCGLEAGGATHCWGFNQSGQLGDGTQASASAPTAVTGGHLFTGLSAGNSHSCGLVGGGALFCWGGNGNGRLGDGTTTARLVPTPVTGGLSFSAVSAGGAHTCGITTAGAGYCWGNGGSGLLGTGGSADQLAPAAISGGLLLAAISADVGHSCALTTSGQAFCWGFNGSGELGDGTVTTRLVPTAVSGGLTWTAIKAGAEHSCGRGSTGGVYCWGKNTGVVGDGTLAFRVKPVGAVHP